MDYSDSPQQVVHATTLDEILSEIENEKLNKGIVPPFLANVYSHLKQGTFVSVLEEIDGADNETIKIFLEFSIGASDITGSLFRALLVSRNVFDMPLSALLVFMMENYYLFQKMSEYEQHSAKLFSHFITIHKDKLLKDERIVVASASEEYSRYSILYAAIFKAISEIKNLSAYMEINKDKFPSFLSNPDFVFNFVYKMFLNMNMFDVLAGYFNKPLM